jgi:hypothetical protein
MTCGIYKLNFNGTNKVYIGKSVNIEYRLTQHLYKFNNFTAAKKLQQAFYLYGTPVLEILVECEKHELDAQEKEAIEIFDAVENGFNTYSENRGAPSETRACGEDSASAVYSNSIIETVFLHLVFNTSMTSQDISDITGVNVHTIRAISSLNEHKWLKLKYPEQYSMLEALKGLKSKTFKYDSAALGIVHPPLISPNGIVYRNIQNVKQFCREHSLTDTNLGQVLKGRRKSHKGWRVCLEELV